MKRTLEFAAYYSSDEGQYVASCDLYPNLSAAGMTAEEAFERLEVVISEWQKFVNSQPLTTVMTVTPCEES